VLISELKPGDNIAASSFTIETNMVDEYIEAVEESSGYFTQSYTGAVAPPLACAGLAMAALLKDIEFPEGAIHLSQEIKLNKPVRIGQTIRLGVDDENGEEVLEGKTSFILTEQRDKALMNG
jgi:hypothetical protein